MFTRKDYPTIMSGLVVRYSLQSEMYDGEVNASRDGVSISGQWPIMNVASSVILEEYITRARIHHLHILEAYGRGFYAKVEALSEDEVERRLIAAIPSYDDETTLEDDLRRAIKVESQRRIWRNRIQAQEEGDAN